MNAAVGSKKGSPMERPCQKFRLVGGLAGALLFAGVILAQTPSAPSPGAAAKAAPASPKSSGSYSLGVSMGEQLHRAGMDAEAVSVERVAQGLRDALAA